MNKCNKYHNRLSQDKAQGERRKEASLPLPGDRKDFTRPVTSYMNSEVLTQSLQVALGRALSTGTGKGWRTEKGHRV